MNYGIKSDTAVEKREIFLFPWTVRVVISTSFRLKEPLQNFSKFMGNPVLEINMTILRLLLQHKHNYIANNIMLCYNYLCH